SCRLAESAPRPPSLVEAATAAGAAARLVLPPGYRRKEPPDTKEARGDSGRNDDRSGSFGADLPLDAGENLRRDGTVHGEAHEGQSAGLLATDLHARDVDAGVPEDGSDRPDHSGSVLVQEERHVPGRGHVHVEVVHAHQPLPTSD